MDDAHQRVDLRNGHPAAASLVGVGRVREAIAEHPGTAGYGRPDEVFECVARAANISSNSAGLRHRFRTALEQRSPAGVRRGACRRAPASA